MSEERFNPWEGQQGQPECLAYTPKGWRDVMWCPHLNEPIIIEHRGGPDVSEPHCTGCGVSSFDHIRDTHEFIAHIYKPWGKEAEDARAKLRAKQPKETDDGR